MLFKRSVIYFSGNIFWFNGLFPGMRASCTSWCIQKFCKICRLFFTACPSLICFMKVRSTGMVLAVFRVWRIVSRIELSAAATIIAQELSTCHFENFEGIENRITELMHIFQESSGRIKTWATCQNNLSGPYTKLFTFVGKHFLTREESFYLMLETAIWQK